MPSIPEIHFLHFISSLFYAFFLLEIFRISTDLDNNIRKIPLIISDSVDVNKVQNNGFEVAADRKESKNNLLKIDSKKSEVFKYYLKRDAFLSLAILYKYNIMIYMSLTFHS